MQFFLIVSFFRESVSLYIRILRFFCRLVYQKYCEAMKEVALAIMELLAISLGIHDQQHYKHFFQDGSSIMRCNYYPPCKEPEHAFGTGPHCDPTSLTILHQDQIGGLEVFSDNKWRTVPPRQGAFVVNIGDTFMVRTYLYIYVGIDLEMKC